MLKVSHEFPSRLLVGGEFVEGEGEPETILNPATGETICLIREASVEQLRSAVQAAAAAFPSWARRTPKERSAMLLKLADVIDGHAPELASLESLNCGKPYGLTLAEELPAISDVFQFFAGAVRAMPGTAAGEYMAGYTSFIRRDPIGVVGSIAPWNYPLMMAAWKIGPALAAGNTVVLKPSEQTPLTSFRLAQLCAEIFPPGVLNVVAGRGETVGAALVSHKLIDMVSLTGDVSTGQRVLEAAANRVKKTHLELGGKAPVIIFDDADIEAAVATVKMAAYSNAGQDCTAACRIYAAKKIYDNFVADLSSAVSNIKVGSPAEDAVEMGPVISERQRKRVASFVERASQLRHVEVTTGGRVMGEQGYFYQPTVVAGARQEDEIVRREVFGPVVSITPFSDVEQAINWANDSDYGLAQPRSGHAMAAGQWPLHQDFNTAAPGSTRIFFWSARCRMAG